MRQRRLGAELRRLREEANVSQRDAGEALDGGQAKVSKIENGRQRVTRLELLALLDLYQVADTSLRDFLVELARQSRTKGWWHQYGGALTASSQEMVALETECDRMITYENMVLPGLLQTPEYAAALIRGLEPQLTDEQVQLYVNVRMERQKIFARPEPPQFVCLLDEALLHRPIGGDEVMAAQLRSLISTSRRPKTVIQVVPLSHAVHPGVSGRFRAFFHTTPTMFDVVEVPHWEGNLYLEEPTHVESFRLVFDDIRAAALSSQASMELITRVASQLEHA